MEQESRIEKRAAGATTTKPTQAEVKGKIIEFTWQLKKNGLTEISVKTYGCKLKQLVKAGVNIYDPESVKDYLAKKDSWSGTTKLLVTTIYDRFVKWLGKTWEPPSYKAVQKHPYIPTEKELDKLILACGKKLATFLQLLKETGMRGGEAVKLEWTDIDFNRKVVTITPEKGSNPRILPISDTLIAMLNCLPRKNAKIFPVSIESVKANFYPTRKNIALRLDPRLMKISLHTFRHWKATMEYHKTKDIIHVQQLLGHRDIRNTMRYIYIEKQLFQNIGDNDFHVKVAQHPEEIKQLLEVGFEYVCEKDGLLFFRKRK